MVNVLLNNFVQLYMTLRPQSSTDTFFYVNGNEIWVSVLGLVYLAVALFLFYRARSHRKIFAKIKAGDLTGVAFEFPMKTALLSLGLGTVYLGGYYWLAEQLLPFWQLFAPAWFLLYYIALSLAPIWQVGFAIYCHGMTTAVVIDSDTLILYKPIVTEHFPLKSVVSVTPNFISSGTIKSLSSDIDLEVYRTRNGRREIDILDILPVVNRINWTKGLGEIIAAKKADPSTQAAYKELLTILNRQDVIRLEDLHLPQ